MLGSEEEARGAGDVVLLVSLLGIGSVAGDPHENKYGPPPVKRSLTDVFS
jgi:hypothetical protein